jgi:hypothetical protein
VTSNKNRIIEINKCNKYLVCMLRYCIVTEMKKDPACYLTTGAFLQTLVLVHKYFQTIDTCAARASLLVALQPRFAYCGNGF